MPRRFSRTTLGDGPVNYLGIALTAAALFLAVALVSPFLRIEASDYERAGELGLRLFFGLLIFLMFAGKWSFDVFSPQGLAKGVSKIKTILLILFILVVVSFIIFIVIQAAALFLQTGIDQDAANIVENT